MDLGLVFGGLNRRRGKETNCLRWHIYQPFNSAFVPSQLTKLRSTIQPHARACGATELVGGVVLWRHPGN